MTEVRMLWSDLRCLLLDATRAWWRLLPQILTVYLLGWLGYQLALKAAVITGDWNAWVSLAVFASAFVFRLIAVVLILRLAGNALGVRQLIPAEEYHDDGRESSLTRLLAITLFPFLGIYTAFGLVNQATNQMLIESLYRTGGGINVNHDDVLSKIHIAADTSVHRYVVVLAVIIGAYLVRRSTDLLHERTGWRPLGLLVALMEAFFVLVALVGGSGIVVQLKSWIAGRQIWAWITQFGQWISGLVPHPGFPQMLTGFGHLLADSVWPVLITGLTQPICWLAIAALVYGSNAISVAELWRNGTPLASRIRVANRIVERRQAKQQQPAAEAGDAHHEARPARRHPKRHRLAVEVREAFFSDFDDKYLPTLHSIRIILRGGMIFLGAFVMAYGMEEVAAKLFSWGIHTATGGHPMRFWVVWIPVDDLIGSLPFEPWRICLLAAALKRCMVIFRDRAENHGMLHAGSEWMRIPRRPTVSGQPADQAQVGQPQQGGV